MLKRTLFIARKEVYHILRDPRSLMIVFAMPVLMTFLYGYAINMDIENVTLAVLDEDRSAASRELVSRFYGSGRFLPPKSPIDLRDPEAIFRLNRASALLVVRSGFSDARSAGRQVELGLTIDGSDASMAAAVQAYCEAVVNDYLLSQLPPGQSLPGVRISQQVLYNPDLKSSHFFVPGLIAVILLMISALLTSITIAREKETGTLEQLLTTPVQPLEIIIGKLAPYVVIGMIDGALVLALAIIVFAVPMTGSGLLLFVSSLLYIATALSIGMLISAVARTQQVAMMLALLTTMMPSVLLSGFIFAIKNMPVPMQLFSHIVPARYFVVMVRGIMLKGAGFELLALQALGLFLLMLFFLSLAMRRFTTRIA